MNSDDCSGVKEWFRFTSAFGGTDAINNEINKSIKSLTKKSKYDDPTKIHENCIYCRKKCKFFKINKCWDKSVDEQLNCILYNNKENNK